MVKMEVVRRWTIGNTMQRSDWIGRRVRCELHLGQVWSICTCLLLWDDIDWNVDPIVLICVFVENRTRITLNMKENKLNRTHIVEFLPCTFGFAELNRFLKNKRTPLSPFPGCRLPVTVWTLERRWYSAYFSSWREMKICIIGALTNIVIFTALWLSTSD